MNTLPKTENRKPKTAVIYLFLVMALVILAASCGKKMYPWSPDQTVPATVREFRLTQEGDSLVASWLLPRKDLMGHTTVQLEGCRLYRAESKGTEKSLQCTTDFVLLADIDLAYPKVGKVKGEAVVYQDRDLKPGRRYYYRVAAYDPAGYKGRTSDILSRAWGVLPRAPGDLRAKGGDKMVAMVWPPVTQLMDGSPAQDLTGYVVYRKNEETGWTKLTPTPLSSPQFRDVAVTNDEEYTYKVRAARTVGGDLLESADSPVVKAKPEKLTPPPPLINFTAAPQTEGIELWWDPSPVPDLAGYRLYRRIEGQEKYVPLSKELLTRPHFFDADVKKGQTYHYYATAVDTSRHHNESLPSEEAVISY